METLRPTTPRHAVTGLTRAIRARRKPPRPWSLCLAALALLIAVLPSLPSNAARLEPPIQPSQPPQSPQAPDAICPSGGQCFADVPSGNPFYEFVNRIYQQDLVTGYACGGAGEPCDAENRPYYRPGSLVTRQQMAKFIDNARSLPQIHIEGDSTGALIVSSNGSIGFGVYGSSTGGYGVWGETISGYGVTGRSGSSYGVFGTSTSGRGVYGRSGSSTGVYGYSNDATGVYGTTDSASGNWAGYFLGNVQVTGNLSKGGGSFKIDHPLDPANKYLYHSFVESPDMMNVYNGNVTTDDYGEAVVELPPYFEALNGDFRYQLTVMGRFAQAIVSEKVKDNHFTIETDKPNVEVSWQVTGIRQDPYANAHRIPVEQDKPAGEKGKYLHPTEWGRPESLGVDYDEQQSMQASVKP